MSSFLKVIHQFQKGDREFEDTQEELEDDGSEDDEDDDETNHSRLISNISHLHSSDKKTKKWKASRHEASHQVGEFNLSKSSKDKVKLNDLIQSVKEETQLKKQLKKLEKKKALDKPLEKIESDLVKRSVNFAEVSKEVEKWDDIVEANRNADQLQFPLKQASLRLKPAREVMSHFKPKTKMELEVEQILQNSENVLKEDQPLTVAEEKFLKAMSLEEAQMRHKELQRMRALMSYQEAKMKRQAKIKSKRYHRILKRERIKKELSEFEEVKKDNPELALEKLQELDKMRILERASLKHKNTGKWAKQHKLRSKYDDSVRSALSEQIELSKQLTKKMVHFDDSDSEAEIADVKEREKEDDDEDDAQFQLLDLNDPVSYNPWMKGGSNKVSDKQLKAIEQLLKEEKKVKEITPKDQKKKTREKELSAKKKKAQNTPSEDEVKDRDEKLDLIKNESLITETFGDNMEENDEDESQEQTANSSNDKEQAQSLQIDPNDFITLNSKTRNKFPNLKELNSAEKSDSEDDDEQRMIISEAFADDDVVNDFQEEKQTIIDREKEKDISLHLPGWGSWSGSGIRENKRKVSKFTKKGSKKLRQDSLLGNVIISEKKDEVISKLKVKDLPFPFVNVKQFENSLRQPIGNTWNPETAYRSLTEPKVITQMGKVIEPIDSDALNKRKPERNTNMIKQNIKKK